MMETDHKSGWPNQPAGIALRRLPSLAGRTFLAAVCRGISSNIKLQPSFATAPCIV